MTQPADEPRSLDGADEDLLGRAVDRLRALLPGGWRVDAADPPRLPFRQVDGLLLITDPQGSSRDLLVEVKPRFTPRDTDAVRVLREVLQRDDSRQGSQIIVIARWFSARTQTLLDECGVNYLDLTGNVRLQIDRPAVVIRTVGADRDPDPPRRAGVSLRGDQAGRIVRLLVDAEPPYTATDLADKAGVSLAHVSRLLATLDREALVERGRRGMVTLVDWADLLRRRAEAYQLFSTNDAHSYLSSTGAREVFRQLQGDAAPYYRYVTGSFAAAQRAPIAAPSQLICYVDDPDVTADRLGLLPTEQSADVVLLRPHHPSVYDRADNIGIDGIRIVAPSQLALDSLAGNGRMPAEGEALLGWMAQHLDDWRRPMTERGIRGQA